MSTATQPTAYERAGLSLAEYFRLPHSERQRVKLMPVLASRQPAAWLQSMLDILKTPYEGLDSAVGVLAQEPRFIEMARAQRADIIALLRGLVVPSKHVVDDGRLFVVARELSELLFQTDISDDVPCSLLQLPFRTCYFHFVEPLEDCMLPESSGPRRMVGVYAQEFHTRPIEFEGESLPEDQAPRCILLTFIGEGLPGDPDDDVLRYLTLDVSNPDMPLSDLLEKTFRSMAAFSGLSDVATDEAYWRAYRSALQHTVRTLLYLNTASVRTEAHRPASELDAQISRIGQAKRAKLERKRARVYDYIEVCTPAQTSQTGERSGEASERAMHWRRGHFKNQPHGPRNTLRKLIFVAPVLVSGATSNGTVLKEYHLS